MRLSLSSVTLSSVAAAAAEADTAHDDQKSDAATDADNDPRPEAALRLVENRIFQISEQDKYPKGYGIRSLRSFRLHHQFVDLLQPIPHVQIAVVRILTDTSNHIRVHVALVVVVSQLVLDLEIDKRNGN